MGEAGTVAATDWDRDAPDPLLLHRVDQFLAAGARVHYGHDGWVTLAIAGGPELHMSARRWASVEIGRAQAVAEAERIAAARQAAA